MPVQLPSSFASAAAGQTRDPRASGRGDSVRGSGSGEWSRSNGTRTFRRPSTTPFNQTASANAADASQSLADDEPLSSANAQYSAYEQSGPRRYAKDDLLNIYASTTDAARPDVSHLFVSSWNPNHVNGNSSRGWGKAGETQHVPQDPTVCWDPNGSVRPISLEDLTAEEREMFMTDVNSTLKVPQQSKEGNQGASGQNGRKTSISVANTGSHPMSSPSTASRPGTRRRETADTNPFPSASIASPTASRFSRDDWLPRRSTEVKEPITDEPEEDTSAREPPSRSQTFGLPRANTGGSANFGGTSLWSSTTAPAAGGIGSFGSFALNTSAIGDKRFGAGGSSRLVHLIPKESAENLAGKSNEAANADPSRGWRSRQRTDTDPFGEGNISGSAILGGAQDNSPPPPTLQPQRGVYDTPMKGGTSDFGMAGLNLGHALGNGPASPSETNPYRSPMADRGDEGQDDNDLDRIAQSGHGSEPPSHYGTLSRAFGANAFDGSDRSQTSSVGAKGFPAVNTMTGWPGAPPTGTPDRERQAFNNAFGGSIFSPLTGDLQSPGLSGLGGVFGVSGSSTIGRSSKLGSLFPPAMQAQMHGQDQESLSDSVPDLRQANPLGAIGRGPIGAQPRDAGSPIRQSRNAFEDLFQNPEAARAAFSTADQSQAGLTSTAQALSFPTSGGGSSFSAGPAGADPSTVRTMVMPDRMRWVYLDPQGTMQGPFSGLEMNDWYKANFFSPDLRVKRIEDPDFEPLGQLIRRIGNSREPFLVPQMGIPHGPAPAGAFAPTGTEAVPPLQNAFPSFGRTLTAAQQNDLERRKQEEQLYHARQREIAHHHQAAFGRIPMQPGASGTLHHHSSAHSLQSQPSFGSMSSPIGIAPQPPIGPLIPNSSFFDAAPNVSLPQGQAQPGIGAAPDLFNPDLNLSERQLLANLQASGTLGNMFPSQHAGAPGNDNGLHSQLPGIDQLQKDSQGFSTKLKEFHELRSQQDAEDPAMAAVIAASKAEALGNGLDRDVSVTADSETSASITELDTRMEPTSKKATHGQAGLSLTERVKKTQADAAAAAAAVAAAVVKPVQQLPPSSGLPMPFPPPASTTPIAAPTAQRPVSNLPTRYDERSASGTPDTTSEGAALAPPPAAPWAPQPGTEAQKGPSLKEIQEAEAKKAAKREEAAATLRRAALEQEAAALREQKAAAAIIGLPASSTWGTGSPVSASASGSAWKQPTAVKGNTPTVSTPSTASKKTIADIQREEELRKRKAMEAATVQAAVAAGGAGLGKRYADLASKTSAPPGIAAAAAMPSPGSGWATVGAGGKVKIPTGPAAQTRSASAASNVKTPVPAAAPRMATKQVTVGLKDAKSMAMEEFKKWLNRELGRGLIGVNDIDQFAAILLEMPLDAMLLSEAVYSYSTTMDGRHFADEFVRRKKLADRGMFDKDVSPGGDSKNSSNGGWSEVAKKGGSAAPKEDTNIAGFRMVASKKGRGKKQG